MYFILYILVCLSCHYIIIVRSLAVSPRDGFVIIRGSMDRFANLGCQPDGKCNNCDSFGQAHCVHSDCAVCQCSSDTHSFGMEQTSAGQDASWKCIPNNKLVTTYITEKNSFGAYQQQPDPTRCIHRNTTRVGYLSNSKFCSNNSDSAGNRWLWTRGNQLLNVFTLKCLGMAPTLSAINRKPYYPDVFLDACNASDDKQLWKCKENCLFQNKRSQTYMNYGNSFSNLVLLYSGKGSFSCWRRYSSTHEQTTTLCSQASSYIGCYRYSKYEAMLTITDSDIENCRTNIESCIKTRDIQAPIEITNNQCSIQWQMTLFLNYSNWDTFPLELRGIFSLFDLYEGGTIQTLQVNLKKLSDKFHGQILKLFIRCANSKYGTEETHCALVKLAGNFTVLYQAQPMTTVALALATVTKGDRETESDGKQNGSSTIAIAIAVPLVLVCLVVASVLAFIFYRRRTNRKNNPDTAINARPAELLKASASESENPIYGTEEDGMNECQLYEPGDDHIYHYAAPDKITKPRDNNDETHTYDYATSDDVKATTQEPARYEACIFKPGIPSSNSTNNN